MASGTNKFKYMQKMFKSIGVSVNTNITKNKQFCQNPQADADDGAWPAEYPMVDENQAVFGQSSNDAEVEDGQKHHFNQAQVVAPFQDGRATQLLPLGVQPFRAYQAGATSFQSATNQKNYTSVQNEKAVADRNGAAYHGSLRNTAAQNLFVRSSESKQLFLEQQPNCTAHLKAVAHSHKQYSDPQQALLQHLSFQQGFNLSTSAVDQSMLAMAGAKNARQKKQMNFSSRKQMLKYIENFRVNYKTQLCRNFMNSGECEFKTECCYAHGHHELVMKPISLNKNYKTKMCKQWHEDTPGTCTYGDKCQFIHNEPKQDAQTTSLNFGASPSLSQQLNLRKTNGKKVDRTYGPNSMEQKSTKLTANDKTGIMNDQMKAISQDGNKESLIPVQASNMQIVKHSLSGSVPNRMTTVGLPSTTINAAETHLNAVLSNYKYLSIIPLDINAQSKSSLVKKATNEAAVENHDDDETLDKIANYDFEAMGGRRDKQAAAEVFEFDEFKLIEKNIKKEILDYSSEENSPIALNIDEPTSASSEMSDADDDSVIGSAVARGQQALLAAGCASKDEGFEYDPSSHVKTLGHHIMDRKRLRVFTKITKQPTKKKVEKLTQPSTAQQAKSAFLSINLMQCQQV